MSNGVKTGFTPIELLIVMGILSLLMALIVPAVGRAKDQSKMIVCKSNQKNLLMKCLVYANDHKTKLPVDRRLHNPHTELIGKLSDDTNDSDFKVYYCPSEKSDVLKYSEGNFKRGDISYFYYCFSDRPTDRDLSTFFLKQLPWPRLLNDTMQGNRWVFSDSWFSAIPTAHRWYKKGVNYVVLDGSVHMAKDSPRSEFK